MISILSAFWTSALAPFFDYDFMAKAFLVSSLLAIIGAPVGVFLMFRRLSLLGDALSHALLPGAAIAYLFWGLYFPALYFGGLVAGLVVAGLATLLSHLTPQKDDHSMAPLYLMAVAAGVVIVSQSGSNVDLLHLLFGSILALDETTLGIVLFSSSVAALLWLFFARLILFESLDPQHLKRLGYPVAWIHFLFLFLVVLTLVTGFQAMGTLMSLGLILLPAASARLCAESIRGQIFCAAALGILASFTGLMFSFSWNWPSGPAIVLACGLFFALSFVFGPTQGLVPRWRRRHHPPSRQRTAAILAVGVLSSILFSSQPSPAEVPSRHGPVRVVTSFTILENIVQEIGGRDVTVTSLVPLGADPHGFQPRPSEIVALESTELVILNGWGLEPWWSQLSSRLKKRAISIPIFEVTTLLQRPPQLAKDPHYWQDPRNVLIVIDGITQQLSSLDEAHANAYKTRAASFKSRIQKIHDLIRTRLDVLKLSEPCGMSGHAAFGFLGEAYGIRFRPLLGSSSAQDLNGRILAMLDNEAKAGKIQTVFYEAGSNSIALQSFAKKYRLPSATLYADTLTRKGGGASTYLEFLEKNGDALVSAFSESKTARAGQ